MTTQQLIEQHDNQLAEAQQLAAALNSEWEQAARSGANCEAIEDRQEATAKLCRRLELRIEQLHLEAVAEAEQLRVSQASELRDKIIGKYGDLTKQHAAIKAQADKFTALLVKFNQEAEQVIQTDIRKLKQLGGEALPREVAHSFIGHTYDPRAFDEAWRTTQHFAASGLESGAYQVR